MKIFFDCDGTLVGWDRSLRPGALKVLHSLKELDCELYLWSYGGKDWAHLANETVIRFPFHDIFDKRDPKIQSDLACDNDGIGIPEGQLTYWCENYIEASRPTEDLSKLLDIVQHWKEAGSHEKFLEHQKVQHLLKFGKLRYSDFQPHEDWIPWTYRRFIP